MSRRSIGDCKLGNPLTRAPDTGMLPIAESSPWRIASRHCRCAPTAGCLLSGHGPDTPNRYAIRDWPEGERPRERLIAEGARRLTTAELLAIVLRTGSRGRSAVDLARALLQDLKGLARAGGRRSRHARRNDRRRAGQDRPDQGRAGAGPTAPGGGGARTPTRGSPARRTFWRCARPACAACSTSGATCSSSTEATTWWRWRR